MENASTPAWGAPRRRRGARRRLAMPGASRAEVGALAGLPFQAAGAVVSCVHDMHRAIADRAFGATGPLGAPSRAVHDGVAAHVYEALRLAADAAGRGVSAAAAAAAPHGDAELSASRTGAALLAALNGCAGDSLAAGGSVLAIPMAVRVANRDVGTTRTELAGAFPGASGRLAVFVHGLGGSEHSWARSRPGEPLYASRLEAEAGCTPVFVRYNSGLHVSDNGRDLARLLDGLATAWPCAVDEIALIGHSMGGLVIRGACHLGERSGSGWVRAVRHAFYLGTPHLGAPLEKAANVAAALLAALPETRPLAGLWNRRSAGIKDLRFGSVVEGDWAGGDVDALLKDTCGDVPLLPTAAHHFIGATVTESTGHPVGRVFGDALVRLPSASGRGVTRQVALEPGGVHHHLGGLHHLELLDHPVVADHLRRALEVR